jgi:hypothetical protein
MTRSRTADMLSGLLAAAVALGAAEFTSGLTNGASLIVEVGDQIVARTPGPVIKWGIELLGTNDKPFLLWSVTISCLVLGVLLGPAAGRWRWVGPAAFAGFAAVGALAGAADPLTDGSIAIFIALVAGVAGYITLQVLLTAATPAPASDEAQMPGRGIGDRRQFLQFAGAAGVAAVGSAFVGRRVIGQGVDVESQREAVSLPPSNINVGTDGFEVEGISSLITPNDEFYRIDTALVVPRVDTNGWTLSFKGMVDNPFTLTFDELVGWRRWRRR